MIRDRTVTLTATHIEEAKEALIERRDTHLDSLVARLNEPRVRRADLVAILGGRKDVIELKLASAAKALERGLVQVAAYAKRLGRDVGYLVIFDPKADTPWEDRGTVEEVDHESVTVVVVRA